MSNELSTSIFTRDVQPGRLVLIRYGPLEGKVATIVDMIDLKRVVVDGPTTGVSRQEMPIKWISLLGQTCTLQRGAREKNLKKALAKEDPVGKWAETKWAKRIAATKAKSNLTEFQRFKLQLAKKKMSIASKAAVKKTFPKNLKKKDAAKKALPAYLKKAKKGTQHKLKKQFHKRGGAHF